MIKSIIFDFGGVLLNLDYSKTDVALKSLLFPGSSEGHPFPPALTHLFLQVEKGNINETTFISQLKTFSSGQVSDEQLKDAWNAMLGTFPEERVHMLTRLSANYDIYLLSNTNSIHIEAVLSHLRDDLQIFDFESMYFKEVFYSHRLGMRKPNRDIYQHVLQRIRQQPSEVLFIDDTEQNLYEPAKLGVNCIHHVANSDIANLIDQYIDRFNS